MESVGSSTRSTLKVPDKDFNYTEENLLMYCKSGEVRDDIARFSDGIEQYHCKIGESLQKSHEKKEVTNDTEL